MSRRDTIIVAYQREFPYDKIGYKVDLNKYGKQVLEDINCADMYEKDYAEFIVVKMNRDRSRQYDWKAEKAINEE